MSRQKRNPAVRLDSDRLHSALLRARLTVSKFAGKEGVDLDPRTVAKAFAGKPVTVTTAGIIADALGFNEISEVLTDSSSDALPPGAFETTVGEWTVERCVAGPVRTTNGLTFYVFQMRHQFLEDRCGRGKLYDLSMSTTRERKRLIEYLMRHATISERVHGCPSIAETFNVHPVRDGSCWWVIDRWSDGPLLEQLLQEGSIPPRRLPSLMISILEGLKELHRVRIVFRELTPERIILRDADDRATLTDFELGQLLDGAVSVSPQEWPHDDYRAPEVAGGQFDYRADYYSWGRILVHAATGKLPEPGADLDALMLAGLPKAVWKMGSECLSLDPEQRPRSLKHVLRLIRKW